MLLITDQYKTAIEAKIEMSVKNTPGSVKAVVAAIDPKSMP